MRPKRYRSTFVCCCEEFSTGRSLCGETGKVSSGEQVFLGRFGVPSRPARIIVNNPFVSTAETLRPNLDQLLLILSATPDCCGSFSNEEKSLESHVREKSVFNLLKT